MQLLVMYNGTHSFNLPVIPYVHIPINSSFDCDITTTTTIATTAAPNDNSELRTHTVTIVYLLYNVNVSRRLPRTLFEY